MQNRSRYHSEGKQNTLNKTVDLQSEFYSKLQKRTKRVKDFIQLNKENNNKNPKKKLQKQVSRIKIPNKNPSLPKLKEAIKQIQNSNLSTLRYQKNATKQQYMLLKNRIKYYQINKQKSITMKKQAQQKYNSILNMRYKTLQNKNQLSKKKQLIRSMNTELLYKIRNRSLYERDNHVKKLDEWKKNVIKQINEFKQENMVIKKIFNQHKSQILEKNKELATSIKLKQSRSQLSRMQISYNKKQMAKQMHKKKILKQYIQKQHLLKKNKFLYKKMVKLSKQADQYSQQSKSATKKTQMMLNLGYTKKNFIIQKFESPSSTLMPIS